MPNNPSANFSAWSRRKRAGASSQNWRPTFIIEGADCLERLSDSRMSLDHDAYRSFLFRAWRISSPIRSQLSLGTRGAPSHDRPHRPPASGEVAGALPALGMGVSAPGGSNGSAANATINWESSSWIGPTKVSTSQQRHSSSGRSRPSMPPRLTPENGNPQRILLKWNRR